MKYQLKKIPHLTTRKYHSHKQVKSKRILQTSQKTRGVRLWNYYHQTNPLSWALLHSHRFLQQRKHFHPSFSNTVAQLWAFATLHDPAIGVSFIKETSCNCEQSEMMLRSRENMVRFPFTSNRARVYPCQTLTRHQSSSVDHCADRSTVWTHCAGCTV